MGLMTSVYMRSRFLVFFQIIVILMLQTYRVQTAPTYNTIIDGSEIPLTTASTALKTPIPITIKSSSKIADILNTDVMENERNIKSTLNIEPTRRLAVVNSAKYAVVLETDIKTLLATTPAKVDTTTTNTLGPNLLSENPVTAKTFTENPQRITEIHTTENPVTENDSIKVRHVTTEFVLPLQTIKIVPKKSKNFIQEDSLTTVKPNLSASISPPLSPATYIANQKPLVQSKTLLMAGGNNVQKPISHSITDGIQATASSSSHSTESHQYTDNVNVAKATVLRFTDKQEHKVTMESTTLAPNNHVNGTVKAQKELFNGHDDYIKKLIDLDGHDLKSMNSDDGAAKQTGPTRTHNGHDGVKITKKKQLIDKHFVANTNADEFKSSGIRTDVHNKHINGDVVVDSIKHHRATLKAPTPTFAPVHNGFLGPIIMAEKTFAVVHRRNTTHQHQSPPAGAQLLGKTLVEIIAPTSLLQSAKVKEADTLSTTVVTPKMAHERDERHNSDVLSTTVFQVPDTKSSSTRLPSIQTQSDYMTPQFFVNAQQTESKISDIQIEVYDSTVDSIISSTNFKENDGSNSSPLETAVDATKLPFPSTYQERFTQYVVDHNDVSTPKSNVVQLPIGTSGKPEPAAIEIHINVSEGLGNESEDLEFSYRQTEISSKILPLAMHNVSVNTLKVIDMPGKQNLTDADEILVVEIIDTGDNSTENSASMENFNVNPIFTFRSETVKDVQLKDSNKNMNNLKSHLTDDLFMPNVKSDVTKYHHVAAPLPPHPAKKPLTDRDSDTIFYISNTEVKVVESLPTAISNSEQQLRKNKLVNQFFPASYVSSTTSFPINHKSDEPKHRYEEDIILSPLHNTADSVKIYRSQSDNSPPLDVTYVGESVMEVEQSAAGASIVTTSIGPVKESDVIIQPAFLPEIPIGVPIIGELPPQIELKEIEFMPDEMNEQQRLSVYENDSHGNEVDRILESSIQYGGDLIDEGGVIAGAGFDAAEESFPFRNPAHSKDIAEFAHILIQHGNSNLKKNELIVDVVSPTDLELGRLMENVTVKDALLSNETDFIANGTIRAAEQSGNETGYYVVDEPTPLGDEDYNMRLILTCIITLLPVIIAACIAFGLHALYQRYKGNRNDCNGSTNQLANGKSGHGDPEEPTKRPSETEYLSLPIASTDDFNIENNVRTYPMNSLDSESLNRNFVPNEMTLGNSVLNQSNSVQRSFPGPNGSVTTMTLKNNHLIVETEERNDISRDARETKMHYSNSEKEGSVFVVEVARGIDTKSMPDSPTTGMNQRLLQLDVKQNSCIDNKLINSHEEVQIHQPPQEPCLNLTDIDRPQMNLHQIEEVDEPMHSSNSHIDASFRLKSNTGLSQSDLSSTSSSDSNKRYSYGNQELYTLEHPVYTHLVPINPMQVSAAAEDTNSDDHKSENGHNQNHSEYGTAVDPKACVNETTASRTNISDNKNQTQHNGYAAKESNEHEEESMNNNKLNSDLVAEHRIKNGVTSTAEQSKFHAMTNGTTMPNGETTTTTLSDTANENPDIKENGYDSLMSLPDPPSNEEIKELNDFCLIDTNQFDSLLPPPPPPLIMTDDNDSAELKKTQLENIYQAKCIPSTQCDTNKLNNLAIITGTTDISASPLTPPESPPPHNGRVLASAAIPVDVSSS